MHERTAKAAGPAATVADAPRKRRGVVRVRHWFRDGPLRQMFKNAGILRLFDRFDLIGVGISAVARAAMVVVVLAIIVRDLPASNSGNGAPPRNA